MELKKKIINSLEVLANKLTNSNIEIALNFNLI